MREPKSDFRFVRGKLPPESFLVHPEGPEPPPDDLVEENVWSQITWLTDDVSIRTSETFGTDLKAMHELWGSAIEMSELQGDPWFHVVLDVADNLQAALFNSLCGYYKVSASCLRMAVENVVVGAYLQIEMTENDAIQWQNGDIELTFGRACDRLSMHRLIQPIEVYLRTSYNYSLFQQRSPRSPPGWVRALYSELSEFSHARPTHSDAKMWDGSNGPVFVATSFNRIYALYLNVSFLLFVVAKLGRPNTKVPDSAKWIFNSIRVHAAEFMQRCFQYVFGDLP